MAEQNISSERKIKLNKEPSISFRYKIKGSQGKILNGTFEGPMLMKLDCFYKMKDMKY